MLLPTILNAKDKNRKCNFGSMGDQTSYGKGPQPLMWACSLVTRAKTPICATLYRLNYCVILQ